MKRTGLTTCYGLATLALATVVWAAPAGAQSQNTAQDRDDLTQQQLAGFDQFLDSHPDLAAQIRRDPSLVDNQEFVQNHPDLQQYLQQHPEVRADLRQNPNAAMRQEQAYERHENDNGDQGRNGDITRPELARFNSFLDEHPEIAEQLRKNPSLVDDQQFVKSHPALQQFLADHPEIRQEMRENPNAFMSAERRYDYREDQRFYFDMNRFLNSHPEIAQQLQKDPSLVDNKQFVANHPELQKFLTDHPELAQDYESHPNEFMNQEERYQQREDAHSNPGRYDDAARGQLASFHNFLQGHDRICDDITKNPSLANNQEYLENHTELQAYLKANPQVSEQLRQDPQSSFSPRRTLTLAPWSRAR